MPQHQIRAQYDRRTITVYQAFKKEIALPAAKNDAFSTPFSFNRMTWIKPSFLWLMARCNWARKSGQEFILAIRISRDGFEEALSQAVLTSPEKEIYPNAQTWHRQFKEARVHVQWDPERSLRGSKLGHRSIQIGISRFLIDRYNKEWIESIANITPLVHKIHKNCQAGNYSAARRQLPKERPYSLPDHIAQKIGISAQ